MAGLHVSKTILLNDNFSNLSGITVTPPSPKFMKQKYIII